MHNFDLAQFLREGGIEKKAQLLKEEQAPGFDTRKQGEPLPTAESVKAAYEAKHKMTEGKSFEFTIDYNTDDDDIEYIENLLRRAKVNASAEKGTFDDEMVIKAGDAIELRKARKAIQADGFQINEAAEFNEDYDTEGYVEAMGPELDTHIDEIIRIFTEWKSGPMTEPGMEGYAKDDLVNYIQGKIRNA